MFRKLCISAAALLAASLCLGGNATAASGSSGDKLDQLQPLVQPSIVYESITWKGFVWDIFNKEYVGQEGSSTTAKQFSIQMQCTGYVVNPAGWIATAGHCVDQAGGREEVTRAAIRWRMGKGFYKPQYTEDQLYKILNFRVNTFDSNDKLHRNTVDRTIVTSWGASVSGVNIAKSKPAFVRAFHKHEDGDAALLKVDETDLNAALLGDAKNVNINDDVVAIGYPAVIDSYTDADLTPTFDPGTVSSRKTVANGLLPVLQMSAQLSGGMSGGPTVNSDGEVIGTNVSHFPGEAFNYAIPVDQVQELMNSTGVKNELSATTKKYRAGIAAYYDKDKTTAVKNLKAVVAEQPGNGFAADFLKKSQALPNPKPKDTGGPGALLWVVLGLVLLLLIIGGVVALLMSRRRKGGGQPVGAAQLGAPGGPGMVGGPMGGPGPGAPGGPPPVGPGGYPAAPAQGGYPGAPAPGGYPGTPAPGGYPPAPEPSAPVGAPGGTAPVGDPPTRETPAPVGQTGTPTGLVPPAPVSPNGRDATASSADSDPGAAAVGAERTAPIGATTVSDPETGHHFCTNCGNKVTAETKFCGECGAHL